MKNLILGTARGYNYYTLEPFVRSFVKKLCNTDLVLFVDNISDFTRSQLQAQSNRIKKKDCRIFLEVFPKNYDNIKDSTAVNIRWLIFFNYLKSHREKYQQVLISDTRDVIFQDDLFSKYANEKEYLLYVTENVTFENNSYWAHNMKQKFGEQELIKLRKEFILNAGTICGSFNEVLIFTKFMTELLQESAVWGDDQVVLNYLIHNDLLPIKNKIVSDNTKSGEIFIVSIAANMFGFNGDKIIYSDGKAPSMCHQYDAFVESRQFADKIYRDHDFKPDYRFVDPRNAFEQIPHLMISNKNAEAITFFVKYVFGQTTFSAEHFKTCETRGYFDSITKMLDNFRISNISPIDELLELSVQRCIELIYTSGNPSIGFAADFIISLYNYIVNCNKNSKIVSPSFKNFVATYLMRYAVLTQRSGDFSSSAQFLDMVANLDISFDQNFYVFQSEIYRQCGRKEDSLSAYKKALDFNN